MQVRAFERYIPYSKKWNTLEPNSMQTQHFQLKFYAYILINPK